MSDHLNYQPKCRKIPLSHLAVSPRGIEEPLCQTCVHRNCGNPIEPSTVSILGVNKTLRCYNSHGVMMAVVDCEAYHKQED